MTWLVADAETLASCEDLHRDAELTVDYLGGVLVPGGELYAECTSSLEFDVHGLLVLNSITAIGDAVPISIPDPEPNLLSAPVTPVGCDDADLPDHDVCGFDTATVTISKVLAVRNGFPVKSIQSVQTTLSCAVGQDTALGGCGGSQGKTIKIFVITVDK